MTENIFPEDVTFFIKTLKEKSIYDFSEYSIKSITRRIEKIVNDHNSNVSILIDRMLKDKTFLYQIVKVIRPYLAYMTVCLQLKDPTYRQS